MRGDFGGCTFRTYRSGPTGGPGPAMSFALCSQGGGGVKGEQRPYPTEGGEMTTQIQVLASKPVFGWVAPNSSRFRTKPNFSVLGAEVGAEFDSAPTPKKRMEQSH